MIDRMQARTELYEMVGLHAYEALDASIIGTIVAEAALQTFWRLYNCELALERDPSLSRSTILN